MASIAPFIPPVPGPPPGGGDFGPGMGPGGNPGPDGTLRSCRKCPPPGAEAPVDTATVSASTAPPGQGSSPCTPPRRCPADTNYNVRFVAQTYQPVVGVKLTVSGSRGSKFGYSVAVPGEVYGFVEVEVPPGLWHCVFSADGYKSQDQGMWDWRSGGQCLEHIGDAWLEPV